MAVLGLGIPAMPRGMGCEGRQCLAPAMWDLGEETRYINLEVYHHAS